MDAPYETGLEQESPLIRMALSLSGSRLNPLVLMSDPKRTPDILDLAARLPHRSALIYRHYGQSGLETRLREVTHKRGVQLLVGADPELARICGADGVHFPRHTPDRTLEHWREAQPDWIISTAARKDEPESRTLKGVDALFVSSIFPSSSPSAGTAIGVSALNRMIESQTCPIYALGGINNETAGDLSGLKLAGIAAIDGLADILRTQRMTDSMKTKPGHSVHIAREEQGDRVVFTAHVDGEAVAGELTLRKVSDGLWNANHTGVPREIGGRGVGKALVKALVEDARARDYRVVPDCPFVARLFERKPDWADGVSA